MGKEEGRSSATDYVTDVTDITDVSPRKEGRRKKEERKNNYSCISDFRVLNTRNRELVRPFDYAQKPRSGRSGTA
ncbi:MULTISPECIES: hypothetical protein [unclassified Microcoleus]|uniref:hypothetical protein n=1 Tax=unclassified Microcoleus TaxID=2642155 RepID=UPI002FD74F08